MSGWRPTSPPEVARRRADMLQRVRDYFAAQDVLAVDTPALSRFGNTDPHTESLVVGAGSRAPRYLQTSPEAFMKRLLAAGYPDIYSICRVFRGGESGSRHLPEFTMIEWYRLEFTLQDIIADTLGLLAACLEEPGLPARARIVDYSAALAEHAAVDVFAADAAELASAAAADDDLCRALGADRDAWLDLLLDTVVVPALPTDTPTVIRHFPASKCAQARLCPANPQVADRFEVFYRGSELANGYVELRDADEQRRRMQADGDLRSREGMPEVAPDEAQLAALEHGLPACAGVAVGFERLHMLRESTEDIADVVSFAERTDYA